MPNLDNLKPISQFTKDYAPRLGLKPNSLTMQINRHQDELIQAQAVFKTRGKGRLIDTEKFMNWYLCH